MMDDHKEKTIACLVFCQSLNGQRCIDHCSAALYLRLCCFDGLRCRGSHLGRLVLGGLRLCSRRLCRRLRRLCRDLICGWGLCAVQVTSRHRHGGIWPAPLPRVSLQQKGVPFKRTDTVPTED